MMVKRERAVCVQKKKKRMKIEDTEERLLKRIKRSDVFYGLIERRVPAGSSFYCFFFLFSLLELGARVGFSPFSSFPGPPGLIRCETQKAIDVGRATKPQGK